jgi:hypothetical protein
MKILNCFAILPLLPLPVMDCAALPVITRQPTPATNSVSLGVNLTNRVTATSTNAPLTYQWRHNGVDIPDATTNILTLVDMRADQGGIYTLVASDSSGSVESRPWGIQIDPTFKNHLRPDRFGEERRLRGLGRHQQRSLAGPGDDWRQRIGGVFPERW